MYPDSLYFNSKVVRLKDKFLLSFRVKETGFQFQSGAVKSFEKRRVIAPKDDFNSKVVRLKGICILRRVMRY